MLIVSSSDQLYHDRKARQPRIVEPVNRSLPRNESPMRLENSKHKVYIHDLDDELAEEHDERPLKSLSLLPEFDRRVTAVPTEALRSRSDSPTGRELVLYTLPASLSVPEEHDGVRRAIAEARLRLRQQQARDYVTGSPSEQQIGGSFAGVVSPRLMVGGILPSDSDAMDID